MAESYTPPTIRFIMPCPHIFILRVTNPYYTTALSIAQTLRRADMPRLVQNLTLIKTTHRAFIGPLKLPSWL